MNNFSLLKHDIQEEYVKYRKFGETRQTAIDRILEDYSQELEDDDDRLAVLLGLSLALCKKRELVESVAKETLNEIQYIRQWAKSEQDHPAYKQLTKYENQLKDHTVYGDEAAYKRVSIYTPSWEIGDTFSHKMTFPASEALGIKNWFILLTKVGERVDMFGVHEQLMYVSLCPPDKLPTCSEDLQRLGFLRLMRTIRGTYEYRASIEIKSKRKENAYDLTYVGCYPIQQRPADRCDEHENYIYPLFDISRMTDPWKGYEYQICLQYKEYGRIK